MRMLWLMHVIVRVWAILIAEGTIHCSISSTAIVIFFRLRLLSCAGTELRIAVSCIYTSSKLNYTHLGCPSVRCPPSCSIMMRTAEARDQIVSDWLTRGHMCVCVCVIVLMRWGDLASLARRFHINGRWRTAKLREHASRTKKWLRKLRYLETVSCLTLIMVKSCERKFTADLNSPRTQYEVL